MVDYRIRTFLTLYEVMNYRRAAQRLQMSQPAVTQQIHALEREYGCRLFVYDGRRLHRTPQADQVAEYARVAVYNEQKMRRELTRPSMVSIRMGATKTIGDFVIAGDLCRFLRRPDRTLEVAVDNTATLLRLLEQEKLDFALVEGEFDKSRYGFLPFADAPFVGMCHHSHPFAGQTVEYADLAHQSVILREEGSGTRAIFEDALRGAGFSLDELGRVICVGSFSLIVRLVRENLGISFAYEAVCRGQPDIATFRLQGLSETRTFHFVYLKGTDAGDLIGEIFSSPLPRTAGVSGREKAPSVDEKPEIQYDKEEHPHATS